MWRLLFFWRWPRALLATAWHNRECRKLQPTWTWRKRWPANWWFFVMCVYGIVG